MMKIIVVSDSHGFNERIDEVLRWEPDADCYIHCGDIEDMESAYPMFRIVKGNNDFIGNYPDHIQIPALTHRILVMHGHQFSYANRISRMAAYAKQEHCDIICYGHTHIAAIDHVEGVLAVNPGSLWRSRNGRGPSYAVLVIENDQVQAQIKFLNQSEV